MTMTVAEPPAVTRLLSRNEAAAFLGIRPCTLAQWTCAGRYHLPIVRIGRRVMYDLLDVEAYIERCKVRAPQDQAD